MTDPAYSPGQPYLQPIPGGLSPGKIAHLTGTFSQNATALVLKIQSGSYGDPNDEIGLCIYARLNEGIFGMNAFTRTTGWGQEETHPVQGFIRGQAFELTILCDPYHFKIAINGQHFGEFSHRLDPASLTYFNIVSGSNDLTVHCVWIEDPSRGQMGPPVGQPQYSSAPGAYAPYPSPVGQQQYSPQNAGFTTTSHSNGKGGKGLLGMVGSAGAAVAGALGASHLLGKSKGYPGHGGGGYGGPPQQYGGGYPGYQQPQYGGGGYPGGHKSGGGGLLNKAVGLGGGILGAKAMSKGMGGGLGGLGGGKALKYGIPLAGAGVGGYMLSKGLGGMGGGHSFSFDDSFSDSD